MKNPTRRQAKKIWRETCKHYGTKTIYPRGVTARLMSLLRGSPLRTLRLELFAMGIAAVDDYLATHWITIVHKNIRYISIPDRIGARGTNPTIQIIACAHEHQHVEQCLRKSTDNKFYGEYFLRSGARALLEGEAEAADADVRKALDARNLSADSRFTREWRTEYRLSLDECDQAKATYRRLTMSHRDGAYATSAGAVVGRIVKRVLG